MFQNALYKGIPELLGSLINAKKNLIIATSKVEIYTKQILENLKIDKYFSFICGSTLDGSRSTKGQIIQYILKTNNLLSDNCIMIGDKSHDILGARESNMDSVGVLYGYGSYEELKEAKATYIAKDVKETISILENLCIGE